MYIILINMDGNLFDITYSSITLSVNGKYEH